MSPTPIVLSSGTALDLEFPLTASFVVDFLDLTEKEGLPDRELLIRALDLPSTRKRFRAIDRHALDDADLIVIYRVLIESEPVLRNRVPVESLTPSIIRELLVDYFRELDAPPKQPLSWFRRLLVSPRA